MIRSLALPTTDKVPEQAPDQSENLVVTPEIEAGIDSLRELYELPLESFVETARIATATDLFERFATLWDRENWAFRGHARFDWELQPTIERLRKMYNVTGSGAEEHVKNAFERRAYHYLPDPPAKMENLEWLALMRHHGAPTRLLDWTRSPYVAAFFALDEADNKSESAIWAVNIQALKVAARELLVEAGVIGDTLGAAFSFSERAIFNTVFMGNANPAIVAPVQPFRTNERVTAQQGLFLCQSSDWLPFEVALKNVLRSDREKRQQGRLNGCPSQSFRTPTRLFELVISPEVRRDALRELHRMNINQATLFPGLDSFGRSLRTNFTIHQTNHFGDEFDPFI
jgi:FRG domain